MDKNPGRSFDIEESFPLKGTYADAIPLAPLMELRGQNGQNSFTAERASQSLDYWRETTRQVLSDAQGVASDPVLRSYSHDVVATANLLAAHNCSGQAEEAYGLAMQLCPYNPEPALGLAKLLAANGQSADASQLLADFARKDPDQRKFLEESSAGLWKAATLAH